MTSTVWFAPVENRQSHSVIKDKVTALFRTAISTNQFISPDDFVGLKMHFGEKHNTGHVKPGHIEGLLQRIKSSQGNPYLVDTNTLYEGQRSNSIDHLMQAAEHGFTVEQLGVPVIIADGLRSKNYSRVPVDGEHLDQVHIANDILHADALIGITHLTGHPVSCVGATIKNIGMGCASRSGKQQQHADIRPEVDSEKCTACGECVQWCPVGAISMTTSEHPHAKIDLDTCYGCGECVATCQYGAVTTSFGGSSESLQEKMAEYAYAVLKNKRDKSVFFNFLIHITEGCDCFNKAQDRAIEDIGILASFDPVAVDKASIDLVNKEEGSDFFQKLQSEYLEYSPQLNHGENMGLGTQNYDLVQLS